MRILILNPYHAGSHAAFVEGWVKHSRHTFEVLTLPGYHWKWRMRHAAATFAGELSGTLRAKPQAAGGPGGPGGPFDAVFCSSMLDLAAFYGLCPSEVFRGRGRGPAVVYFHENQLTYPTRGEDSGGGGGGRDYHFAVTQLTSGLAAVGGSGAVWWNSAFHRDSFLVAARKLLKKMPGRELDHVPDVIERGSRVVYPGVGIPGVGLMPGGGRTGTEVPEPYPRSRKTGADRPLHLLWVARWEHDKDPDGFFAALKKLKKRGVRFRLSVLGESFERVPGCFAVAKKRFADEIVRWGYQSSRADYESALREADVVVSTARHEFFGIAIVEAVAAGCFPVLPRRLAYPEVFGDDARFYYDGTPEGLAMRLEELSAALPGAVSETVERYGWSQAAARLDEGIEGLMSEGQGCGTD